MAKKSTAKSAPKSSTAKSAPKSAARSTAKSTAKSTTKSAVSASRNSLESFKMEAAKDVGVNLKQGYNGNLTAKEAGSVGGQMVKKMIESYEKNMK